HDCSDCFRLERFAGWGLHPLESAAFARRTPKAAHWRPYTDLGQSDQFSVEHFAYSGTGATFDEPIQFQNLLALNGFASAKASSATAFIVFCHFGSPMLGMGFGTKSPGADRPFQRPKFSAGLESVVDACQIERKTPIGFSADSGEVRRQKGHVGFG